MQPIIPIKLGEEDHFFHFNNYALIEMGHVVNSDTLQAADKLNELISKNFLLGITSIIYCGLVGYQYSKFNIAHGYTKEWVSEHVANADMNSWTPIWEAYKQATGMSEFVKNQAEKNQDIEAVEKKSPPSKKSSS